MSRILVIPDIHNRTLWLEPFLDKMKDEYDSILFLGDYFDSWDDGVENAEITAQWLKASLGKPNRIHLWGNHDIAYCFPKHWCSGYSDEKKNVIQSIITHDEWKTLRFIENIDGVYYTHGGIDERIYPLKHTNTEFWDLLVRGEPVPELMAVPRSRGGDAIIGGILWCTWRELQFPEVRQICGHTIHDQPRVSFRENNRWECELKGKHFPYFKKHPHWALNLDTQSQHYAIVRDGIPDVRTLESTMDDEAFQLFKEQCRSAKKRIIFRKN